MKNKEYHIIYVMYIHKYKSYKIGITEISRVNNRLKEIERDFGKVDKNQSYMYFSPSAKSIKNIEKGIHTLSWKYSKNLKQGGSGKTEFFKKEVEPFVCSFLSTSKKMYNLSGPVRLNGKKVSSKIPFYIFLFTLPTIIYFLGQMTFS